jgi:hypothetical protein
VSCDLLASCETDQDLLAMNVPPSAEVVQVEAADAERVAVNEVHKGTRLEKQASTRKPRNKRELHDISTPKKYGKENKLGTSIFPHRGFTPAPRPPTTSARNRTSSTSRKKARALSLRSLSLRPPPPPPSLPASSLPKPRSAPTLAATRGKSRRPRSRRPRRPGTRAVGFASSRRGAP